MTPLDRVCETLVANGAPAALVPTAAGERELTAAAGSASPDDRFRAGSVTKTAVGALVLRLAEDELLGLGMPVRSWADVLASFTIRDLLRHTSGLPDYAASPAFRERFLADPEHQRQAQELLELAGPASLEPGTFAYSNTNYVVLGLVAEAVGGAPLARQLEKRVLEPLALHDTELTASGGAAAGGLVSTARDVARFLRGLLGGEVLSPASLEPMLTTISR